MSDSLAALFNGSEKVAEIRPEAEGDFTRRIDDLSEQAETFRMSKMRRYGARTTIALVTGMLAMLAGASGFGWYFLMEGDLPRALGCILLAVMIPAALHYWAGAPVRSYQREFKTRFMPGLAQAIGGLHFYPTRGISEGLVRKSGILPAFDTYRAEDCFMGRHAGVKVILSEARLHRRKKLIFQGVFALLDIETEHFEGVTIITASPALRQTAGGRMKPCPVKNPDYAGRLSVFTNQDFPSSLAADERLLKEIYEMSVLFDNAPLSVIFWHKHYIFMAIPHEGDMFECSNLFVPVSTRHTAQQLRREVEQLLSIIDVVNLYKK